LVELFLGCISSSNNPDFYPIVGNLLRLVGGL